EVLLPEERDVSLVDDAPAFAFEVGGFDQASLDALVAGADDELERLDFIARRLQRRLGEGAGRILGPDAREGIDDVNAGRRPGAEEERAEEQQEPAGGHGRYDTARIRIR